MPPSLLSPLAAAGTRPVEDNNSPVAPRSTGLKYASNIVAAVVVVVVVVIHIHVYTDTQYTQCEYTNRTTYKSLQLLNTLTHTRTRSYTYSNIFSIHTKTKQEQESKS